MNRNDEIRQLRASGLTLQSIGTKFGITRERVRQICSNIKPHNEPKIVELECFSCSKPSMFRESSQRKINICTACYNLHLVNKRGVQIGGREYVRTIVRMRDKFECRECGSKAKGVRALHVHHLNGMCGKVSRKYDKMDSIDTLVTLCPRCHAAHPEHSGKNKYHNRIPKSDFEVIKNLRETGSTFALIAELYGVSEAGVSQFLKRHSI